MAYTREPQPEQGLVVWPAKEVIKRLGISRSGFYRMLEADELPPRVRLSGKRFGWRKADIEAWVQARIEPPKTH